MGSVKRSYETQLLKTVNHLVRSLNARGQTDYTILLDFSKTLNKVCHRKLNQNSKYYGIGNSIISSWIQDFLCNRNQTVVVRGIKSLPVKVISGVKQGSVLSPLLFLVYINDNDILLDQLWNTTQQFGIQ